MEDITSTILEAVAHAGPEGVVGMRAFKGLVKGNAQAIGAAVGGLVDAGMLVKSRHGKADRYTLSGQTQGLLEDATHDA